jgi:hypothetical protein
MATSCEIKRANARVITCGEVQYNALATHVKGVVTHSDEAAVRRALDAVAHVKSNRQAARILGVSEPTLRRWRAGEIAVPLREPTRSALQRFFARRNEGGRSEPEQARAEDVEGFESLLYSRSALYQTLSSFGGPGERTDDKLSLIDLLSKVAADLRREGRRLPVEILSEAHADILRGKI